MSPADRLAAAASGWEAPTIDELQARSPHVVYVAREGLVRCTRCGARLRVVHADDWATAYRAHELPHSGCVSGRPGARPLMGAAQPPERRETSYSPPRPARPPVASRREQTEFVKKHRADLDDREEDTW